MGRRERREAERLTGGRRPDDLSDASRSWFLRYPEKEGQLKWSDLLPFGWLVRGVQWLGFTAIVLSRRLTGRAEPPIRP